MFVFTKFDRSIQKIVLQKFLFNLISTVLFCFRSIDELIVKHVNF